MLKNGRRYLIISLVLIEMISLFLAMKSFSNKEIDELKETYEVDKKHFSMFINDGNDNYTEYTSSNMFPEGYIVNISKSSCIDNKGNIIEGILSSSGNSVTVKSNTTTYCYLYFDEATAVDTILANAGDDLWESTLEGDGYRFIGTDPSNYICFGTTDKDICTSDTDKYMYRIIGIFEDTEGNKHLKLIKKESLNTGYAWHSDSSTDTDWDASDLYNGINGSYFLSNTTYSYMQDTNWTNKIADWDYTATNTKSYENFNENSVAGLEYNGEIATNVYLHEMNRSSKTSSVGEWKTVNAKIGLMYASDYLLSLGVEALNSTASSNYSTLKTGWMHISNNDSGAPSSYEWTMSRYGAQSTGPYSAWGVLSNGNVYYDDVIYAYSVRTVFYLEADAKLDGGSGTSSDPYIIYKEPTDTEKMIENVSSDVLWESTLEDDGYRYVGTNPDNYICFGTTDKETCTSDTDKYMYRIIGIFEDSSGEKHLKLIKKEALNTAYTWHSDLYTDTDWDASDLYNGINGSYFLTNTTYSYMQDTNWTNKIETWDYTATNTLSYENYSANSVYGIYYYYNTVKTVYLHEMNRSSKTNQTCYYDSSTTADCSVGEWKTVNAKIGLMYVSDYQLSLGETALDYTNNNSTHLASMKTGWIHLSNNDSASLSTTASSPHQQQNGPCRVTAISAAVMVCGMWVRAVVSAGMV